MTRLDQRTQRGWLRQRRGGRWVVTLRVDVLDRFTGEPKRRAKVFEVGDISDLPTRDDAREVADMIARRVNGQRGAQPGKPIAVVRWLTAYQAGPMLERARSTQRSERCYIRGHLRAAWPGLRVDQVDAQQLQALIDDMAASGFARGTVVAAARLWLRIAIAAQRAGYAACLVDKRDLRYPPRRRSADADRVKTSDDFATDRLAADLQPYQKRGVSTQGTRAFPTMTRRNRD